MFEEERCLFQEFTRRTITELQELLDASSSREEMLFYHRLLALKMGIAQEKVVGMELL